MKSVVSKSVLAGALALLGLSAAARATATVTVTGDQGTWRVLTFDNSNAITGAASTQLTNPYRGNPITSPTLPVNPIVTALPGGNGWTVLFPNLSSDFMAYASNSGGHEQVTMDGKLDFTLVLDSAQKLTFNLYEGGGAQTIGGGTVGVTGVLNVQAFNSANVSQGTVTGILPPLTAIPGSNSSPGVNNFGWSDFTQAGFASQFTTYHISIDNTLLADATASQTFGSGYIAKKDFELIITNDGSNGGGAGSPEPASLGVLAMGSLALLARRRRA